MNESVDKRLEQIAGQAINRLFVNGAGQRARRLVLELENGRGGGGWYKSAVRDQVLAELAILRPVLIAAQEIVTRYPMNVHQELRGALAALLEPQER